MIDARGNINLPGLLLILLTIAMPSLNGALAATTNPDGVAVIIGNRNYQNEIPTVDFAHNDADAIRNYVVEFLGYDLDNIIDLRDATAAQMTATFGNERDHKGKLWSFLKPQGGSDIVVFIPATASLVSTTAVPTYYLLTLTPTGLRSTATHSICCTRTWAS